MSQFIRVKGHNLHYIEEGTGKPILFIHGNPTSCYLWRNVLPLVAKATNRRAIAVDLLGFGLSDKPNLNYTVDLHYEMIEGFIQSLDLKDLTIIAHDWGGPIAVRYCIDHLSSVTSLMVMDTFLWNLTWDDFPKEVKTPFKLMRGPLGYLMVQVFNAFLTQFVPNNIHNKENITKELLTNYKKPFPTITSRRAIRAFPRMIPINGKPNNSKVFFERIERQIQSIDIPFKMLIATPGMGEVDMTKVEHLQQTVPHFSYEYFEKSGHYMQEDHPEKLARIIAQFVGQHSS